MNKKMIMIAAFILIAIAVYFLFFREKAATVLALGSKGEDVKSLQTWLNQLRAAYYKANPVSSDKAQVYYKPLDVDGIFGDKTLAMLKWLKQKDTITTDEIK